MKKMRRMNLSMKVNRKKGKIIMKKKKLQRTTTRKKKTTTMTTTWNLHPLASDDDDPEFDLLASWRQAHARLMHDVILAEEAASASKA